MVVVHQQIGDLMEAVDVRNLKAELARQGLTLVALAKRIATPPSTLSAWLHGVNRPPEDLHARIEQALGVKRGAFKLRS